MIIVMYFIKCSYLKKRFFFNNLLKRFDFCGFFQINLSLPDAILIFKEFKKVLFKMKLKFMLCCKKNDFKFLGLNKLIKGPVLVIFCNQGFNLSLPDAILIFKEFKKVLFKMKLKFMLCCKKNDFKFLGLNKLIKGPVLVIFCNQGFNFTSFLSESFFSFLFNRRCIISLCFFLYKRFMFLSHLQSLKSLMTSCNVHSRLIYLLKFHLFRIVKFFHYGK